VEAWLHIHDPVASDGMWTCEITWSEAVLPVVKGFGATALQSLSAALTNLDDRLVDVIQKWEILHESKPFFFGPGALGDGRA